MKNFFFSSGCIALSSLLLSACTSPPEQLETSLGQSVRQAVVQQSVHAAGNRSEQSGVVMDGVAAVHGIERYHQSYARPQPPAAVLNILPGAVSGAATLPALPR